MKWQPHLLREIALWNLNNQLAIDSEAVHLQFERACLLTEMGRIQEAKNAYINLLIREPSHREALNNLGTLLYETGYRTAAKTTYSEAVAKHPNDPMGHVNLANILRENGELLVAREHYETALRLEPNHAQAHQGLSYVLAELGDEKRAAFHRKMGFQYHHLIALPYRGEKPPITLLLLMSAIGGNTPTRNFLDDHLFQTFVVIAEFFDPKTPLPPHQLVFNTISDADLAAPALIAAEIMLALTAAPVINSPSAILASGRQAIAQRFADLPGIVTPKTVTLPRTILESPAASITLAQKGLRFPLLLRTPGHHTGLNFIKADSVVELQPTLDALPGKDLIVIQYLDTRSSDRNFRKYRVMLINGQIHPLHLAISSHWNVHYFTAEMAQNADHRAEEAEFLNNMPDVLGPRALTALALIQSALRLDYAGVDFSLNGDGDVLLFEANATMLVNPPEPDAIWNYRRPAVERIFKAVRALLMEKLNNLPISDAHID